MVVTIARQQGHAFTGLGEILPVGGIAHVDPGGVDHLEDGKGLDQGAIPLLFRFYFEPSGGGTHGEGAHHRIDIVHGRAQLLGPVERPQFLHFRKRIGALRERGQHLPIIVEQGPEAMPALEGAEGDHGQDDHQHAIAQQRQFPQQEEHRGEHHQEQQQPVQADPRHGRKRHQRQMGPHQNADGQSHHQGNQHMGRGP